jgi:acyl-CoA reductase-like NAD-dependent aldehyde dehydrogenase
MPTNSSLVVTNPYTQKSITNLPFISAKDIEQAFSLAHKTYSDRKKWLTKTERISILEKAKSLLEKDKDAFIKLAIAEGGKPYNDTVVEVNRAINGISLAIDTIKQQTGELIPMNINPSSENRLAFTVLEPLGVVFAISAFNHPLNLIVHQAVTAFAAGCPVIVKPALTTPLTCIKFIELLHKAGVPKAYCQVIVCLNEVTEKLVSDKRIAYVSFIGSSKVGWHLRSKLANGTHCALEHGGAAPAIVEPDADVKAIVPSLIKGSFYHAGQVCVSTQRIFVDEKIADRFIKDFVAQTKKLNVGDPSKPTTDVGPIITSEALNRMDTWVKNAKKDGGKILCGGKPLPNNCYEPTVILNPSLKSEVSQHEIFGPVVCIYTYKKLNEAIQQANALPYCFQASVFTKDIDNALKIASELEGTTIMINDHTAFRVDWMPFGGLKESGMGVGGIHYSINEMTRKKLVVVKSDSAKFL